MCDVFWVGTIEYQHAILFGTMTNQYPISLLWLVNTNHGCDLPAILVLPLS